MTPLKAGRTLNGTEGSLVAKINNNNVDIADVKKFSAKIALDKKALKTLGVRGEQQKITGWKGTGAMDVYVVSSLWSKIILDYVNNGKATYFTLTCKMTDPSSDVGSQTVTLTDVLIDEDEIAKLDVDSAALEKSFNFTFSGVSMTEGFSFEDDYTAAENSLGAGNKATVSST